MKQFDRLNGIAVIDDLLVIVERDKCRVQVLQLPDFVSLGVIGEDELTCPYGLYVYSLVPGFYHVFIADNKETENARISSDPEPVSRIRHFTFSVRHEELEREFIQAFGDIDGAGVLQMVETIAGDPNQNTLQTAGADALENGIKSYSLDGEFTGKVVSEGIFQYQPDGMVLYQRPGGGGFWIIAEQNTTDYTFHLFDQATHEFIKSVTGAEPETAGGLALVQDDLDEPYPDSLFFAVHDDGSVSAFSWRDVSEGMQLRLQ